MGILRLLIYFLLQLIIVIIIAYIRTFKAVSFLAERDLEKRVKPLKSHVHGTSLSPEGVNCICRFQLTDLWCS